MGYEHNRAERILRLPGDCVLEFKSADDPDRLVSVGLDMLVLTECQQIPDTAFRESLRPTLDSPDRYGICLATGLPAPVEWMEDWKRLADSGDPDYWYINEPSWMNPHIAREKLEAAYRELPLHVWEHQYGASWPTTDGTVFRRIEDVCVLEPPGSFGPPIVSAVAPGTQVFDGLDPARIVDFMAYCALARGVDGRLHQVGFDHFNKVDWSLQLARVKTVAGRFRNRHGFCDSTGIGDVVIPMLDRAGCRFSEYKFTSDAKQQIVNNLASMFDNDELRLFNLPLIRDELRRFRYTTRGDGYKYSAPEGHHDDIVFALALAAWAAKHDAPASADARAYIERLAAF